MIRSWKDMIKELKTGESKGMRAPHKPLLTLMVLSQAQQSGPNQFFFTRIEEPLKKLLREFGEPTRDQEAHLPFWHLRSSGFWNIENEGSIGRRKNKNRANRQDLLDANAVACVPEPLWDLLQKDKKLIPKLVAIILDQFWPQTRHGAILGAVGLHVEFLMRRSPRNPKFREDVLRAYERRCAVCGFDAMLGDSLFGLEAAHIHWHCYNGEDAVVNGMALCSLHHDAFDAGAISVDENLKIVVSQDVHGQNTVHREIIDFNGKSLLGPQSIEFRPRIEVLMWHKLHVFKGSPRT